MRWAIIGDIHSNRGYLEAVLADARRRGFDRAVLLGDLVEVRVPKQEARRFRFRSMEQVLDMAPGLLEVLAWATVLKGNQEERLLQLVPPGRRPPELGALERLPRRLELGDGVVLAHGHRWRWVNPREDIYHPVLRGLPPRVLVLGHNHQNALFRVTPAPRRPWGWRFEPLPVRYGEAVALDRDRRYVANVADVRRPSWLLYDTAAGTLAFFAAGMPAFSEAGAPRGGQP